MFYSTLPSSGHERCSICFTVQVLCSSDGAAVLSEVRGPSGLPQGPPAEEGTGYIIVFTNIIKYCLNINTPCNKTLSAV